jgi:pilus assembly protein CpaC
VPLSRNLIYVLGKKRGATNLTISDQAGNIISVVDVLVTFDSDALKRSLADVLPEEKVSIQPAGDSLILSGQLEPPPGAKFSVAERYAPGAVTNLLSLGGSQQVLLQVRFAEVQRNALADLGANFSFSYEKGTGNLALVTGQGTPLSAFGAITGQLTDSRSYDLQASVNALEKKGLVRTLASPNLIALSGDTASFLAGGQIPIPVAQTSGNNNVPVLTVEYKDFAAFSILHAYRHRKGTDQPGNELRSELYRPEPLR